jgi:hypothetical protein
MQNDALLSLLASNPAPNPDRESKTWREKIEDETK